MMVGVFESVLLACFLSFDFPSCVRWRVYRVIFLFWKTKNEVTNRPVSFVPRNLGRTVVILFLSLRVSMSSVLSGRVSRSSVSIGGEIDIRSN